MAYNNYYPNYYNPYTPNYGNFNSNGINPIQNNNSANSAPQAAQNTNNPNNFAWVQGINGAKSYLVGAGNSAILLDSEDSVFYIKTVDQSGMPLPLRTFRYSEEKEATVKENSAVENNIDFNKFVTREEFEAEIKKITETKAPRTTAKKGDDNG